MRWPWTQRRPRRPGSGDDRSPAAGDCPTHDRYLSLARKPDLRDPPMIAVCPAGHSSLAQDYCDVCGLPIDAAMSPTTVASPRQHRHPARAPTMSQLWSRQLRRRVVLRELRLRLHDGNDAPAARRGRVPGHAVSHPLAASADPRISCRAMTPSLPQPLTGSPKSGLIRRGTKPSKVPIRCPLRGSRWSFRCARSRSW